MAAATTLQDTYRALFAAKTTTKTTVRTVRFLLNTYKLPYTYDELFQELRTRQGNNLVAAKTRPVVEYLWNRLDKAGVIDLEELERQHQAGIAANACYWAAWDAAHNYPTTPQVFV